MAGHDSSTKAILYAFLANLGIAIAKGVAWFFTGSGSMLAEAVHSLADCTNQLLLFLGLKRSTKPPTPQHPLGYGKVIYFWSFIVAILLFSVGGLFSIYEGVHKIIQPEEISYAWVAILVLSVSILLEGGSTYGALKEIKKLRGDKPLGKWIKESRKAELIVILGEDIGATTGMIVALIFIIIATITGNPVFDAMGSAVIGVILITISIFLTIRVKSLLIGHSADPDLEKLIHDIISKDNSMEKVFKLITIQFGPHIMLSAKIKVKKGLDIDTACKEINELEDNIQNRFPEIKWCFIEPDIRD